MVIALGHRHRLVAGEVVDLLDGDAEVENSCDKGMAEIVGADTKPPSPWLRCKPEGLAFTRDWLVSKSEGKEFIIVVVSCN